MTMLPKLNRLNLKDSLKAFGCPISTGRHSKAHTTATNPTYGAARPLTKEMIGWASADVFPLFALQKSQGRAGRPRLPPTAWRRATREPGPGPSELE